MSTAARQRTADPQTTPKNRHSRRVEPVYWIFLLPALAAFSAFIVYPAVQGITMSFTDSIGFGTYHWIGLRNYIALFRDQNIVSSYKFTLLFAAVTVVLVNAIAFLLALGLTSRIRFTNALRAIYVIPMVVSAIIYSYVFKFLFENTLPQLGQWLGSDTLSSSLLANDKYAWLAIVAVTVWGSVPSAMLIYIAGLMTVPGEVYEASSIDGASGWRNLVHITLPLVAGYIGINVIIGFKNFLSVYDQIVALTGGGPGSATRSVAFTIFNGFSGGDYSYQMANATIFFLITLMIAIIQLRLTKGRSAS